MKTFSPGAEIQDLGFTFHVEPKKNYIKIKFPGRVHVTPIDCNRFDFGKPGGGGIGFAIELDNYLEVQLSETDSISGDKGWSLEIAHLVAVFKKIFNYSGGVSVKLKVCDQFKSHKGFGSTSAITSALAYAINSLYNNVLEIDEIRRIIGYNFVENVNGKLAQAMETGVGTQVVLNGGMTVIADDLRVVYHDEFLPSHYVALIDPGSTRPNHDEPENIEVFIKSQEEDLGYRYIKSYIILMDLIPALYNTDIKKIGDIFWRFQFSGTELYLIQNYSDFGRKIYEVMTMLRNNGVEIIGLSSVGPTIYAVHDNINELKILCESLNVEYLITKINNVGIIII